MARKQTQQQFYDMFIEQLQDIYSAEDQYSKEMPRFLEAISTQKLKSNLQKHFDEERKQKQELKEILHELNVSPNQQAPCQGMRGIIEECKHLIKEDMPGIVKDAALISTLQKVKHYEIASYGALKAFAKHLELRTIEGRLERILNEEWKSDKNLTKVAEGGWFTEGINAEASR